MEYGKLIRDAWAITWRYRFLWVLGLLAGGSAGLPGLNGGGGGGERGQAAPVGPTDLEQVNPALAAAARDFSTWATANVGLLIAIGAIVALVFVALLVLSFVAQGGMAEATADLALGRTSSFARAWSAGVHLFWRYVGLWLILALATILVAMAVAFVAGTAFAAATFGQSPGLAIAVVAVAIIALIVGFDYLVVRLLPANTAPAWLILAVATLFALPLFTVVVAMALLLSVVVAFAQRAIAVENVGPVTSLRSGWSLMRAHLGDSLITWLINVGLTLAFGVACLAGAIGLVVVLGGIGALVFAVAGFSAPTIAYFGLGSIVFVAIALTIIGIANTFFWTYWTLAYLRLSGRAAAA
jgi:hypothetical protein